MPDEFLSHRGKRVGRLVTDHNGRVWLLKNVVREKHQIRRIPGWASSVAHLDALRAIPNAMGLELHDDAGVTWNATLRDFDNYSVPIHWGKAEPQRVLPLHRWKQRGPGVPVQSEMF